MARNAALQPARYGTSNDVGLRSRSSGTARGFPRLEGKTSEGSGEFWRGELDNSKVYERLDLTKLNRSNNVPSHTPNL